MVAVYSNRGIKRTTQALGQIIDRCNEKGGRLIIAGDLNARVGEKQTTGNGEEGERYRRSEDKTLNAEGRVLVNFCEERDCMIRNGATIGDWKGEATYVGGEGHSVLDLVLEVDRGGDSVIDELRIEARVESDHLPVTFVVGRNGQGEDKKGRTNGKATGIQVLRWDQRRVREYREILGRTEEEENGTETNAQEKWNNLVSKIWKAAGELDMIKIKGGAMGETWEPRGIKEQRKRVWASLKRWVRNKTKGNKMTLKEERKTLRKGKERGME